jgi:hypothetical protein
MRLPVCLPTPVMNMLLNDTTVTAALSQSCVERKIQLRFGGGVSGNG